MSGKRMREFYRHASDRMRTKVLVLSSLFIFTACAPFVWYKPGADQQDFNVDSYNCEKDARQSGYFGGGLVGVLNFQDFIRRCMVAHGWSRHPR